MKAFIFDLNGTMVNDMPYHAAAWKRVANEVLGGNFTDEQIKQNMYGKNAEVLVRLFGSGKFSPEEMDKLSEDKEEQYRREFISELALLPGLAEFLERAHQAGIPMAIGSAAIPSNIDFVLDNLNIRHYFKAIVSAHDVTHSKPDPESFTKPAALLGVKPEDCIVFEDVPKGAEAARNAGMKAVILTTTHPVEDFDALDNILHFAGDFNDDYIKALV
ncbi:HAD family hydrolase [Mucilaginibacter psychrotolerans]|uniref:Beta-phosphoglucomutase n=1 Tax=Mucilaginibacter psychrotolerans TaxID=1524096 RepID=A0A4Y8S6X5_9SPHI|nr:HAD family phosphatase [Mucilaginibacter psychrotolerans]TFF34769.1 HAD family phosphatase [Mucilaginibacter psychrotolerans]